MRETTIERRDEKKVPIELITAAETPEKCAQSSCYEVVVLKTLLITDRMEYYSQRVTLSFRQMFVNY